MKTSISMWQVGVAASVLLGPLAANVPRPDVGTAGLGDAKFGMDIEAVERALGRVLVMPKGTFGGNFTLVGGGPGVSAAGSWSSS